MEAPSVRYILTRAVFVLCVIVAVLFGMSFVKKRQKQATLAGELKSLASDSSYFHQFYAADAQKALLRAVGLIAEGEQLGVPSDKAIDRAAGIAETTYFSSEEDRKEPTYRQQLIRDSLRTNYANFRKLGYQADFQTLQTLREGRLPAIPEGPQAGKQPEVGCIIDPALSPGLEKLIPNLEIRPARPTGHVPTDIEIAAAKKLASDLERADIIEEPVRDRIVEKLTAPAGGKE
jgi:hypothetical protein